ALIVAFLSHDAVAVPAVAGAVVLRDAVVGHRLLAVQRVARSIDGVALGLIAVLAAGGTAGDIVVVCDSPNVSPEDRKIYKKEY
ncbi:hypothetical protein ACGK9R_17045, partial [Halomonas sp. HNIBRBA4712]|uniref:hypothetical protein n=1 Tax=Halomonas sp. HNIBRBA4712 TaxID=3373087 RepID=UPI0037471E3A